MMDAGEAIQELADLMRGRMAFDQAGALLRQPDWCRVDLFVAAFAIGYVHTARPAENARAWLAEHGVALLRVGKRWTVTVGDLRRALQEAEAEQKALVGREKGLQQRRA